MKLDKSPTVYICTVVGNIFARHQGVTYNKRAPFKKVNEVVRPLLTKMTWQSNMFTFWMSHHQDLDVYPALNGY